MKPPSQWKTKMVSVTTSAKPDLCLFKHSLNWDKAKYPQGFVWFYYWCTLILVEGQSRPLTCQTNFSATELCPWPFKVVPSLCKPGRLRTRNPSTFRLKSLGLHILHRGPASVYWVDWHFSTLSIEIVRYSWCFLGRVGLWHTVCTLRLRLWNLKITEL